jgi:hypothetical protein
MARGTTTDYSLTAQGVIHLAFELIGVLAPGETLSSDDQTFGLKYLNILIKNLMGPSNLQYRGMKVWQRGTCTYTLKNQNYATIYVSTSADINTDPPVDVISGLIRNSDGDDYPLRKLTRDEYDAIGGKSEEGDPTSFLYEREYSQGIIRWNCKPNDSTKSAILTVHRPLYDVDTVTEDIDFPQEWHLPIAVELAMHMAPAYGKEIPESLNSILKHSVENASTFYPERTTVYFQPDRE